MGRELNNTNAGQKVAQILGHSKDLITLSQVLTYNSLYIIKLCGHPRQDTAFFAYEQPMEQREQKQACLHSAESQLRSSEAQGKPQCFLYPAQA